MELRRKDKSMSIDEAKELLERADVGRLSMAFGNEPYVVPVNFVYDGDIYFHSSKEGRKISFIEKNPRVCFEVDEQLAIRKGENACDWGTRYRSVIVYGNAEILSDAKEKLMVFAKLMQKYSRSSEKFPIPERMMESVNIIKIKVTDITGKKDMK